MPSCYLRDAEHIHTHSTWHTGGPPLADYAGQQNNCRVQGFKKQPKTHDPSLSQHVLVHIASNNSSHTSPHLQLHKAALYRKSIGAITVAEPKQWWSTETVLLHLDTNPPRANGSLLNNFSTHRRSSVINIKPFLTKGWACPQHYI